MKADNHISTVPMFTFISHCWSYFNSRKDFHLYISFQDFPVMKSSIVLSPVPAILRDVICCPISQVQKLDFSLRQTLDENVFRCIWCAEEVKRKKEKRNLRQEGINWRRRDYQVVDGWADRFIFSLKLNINCTGSVQWAFSAEKSCTLLEMRSITVVRPSLNGKVAGCKTQTMSWKSFDHC